LSRRRNGIEPSTNSASTTPSVRASITAKIQVPRRSAGSAPALTVATARRLTELR